VINTFGLFFNKVIEVTLLLKNSKIILLKMCVSLPKKMVIQHLDWTTN